MEIKINTLIFVAINRVLESVNRTLLIAPHLHVYFDEARAEFADVHWRISKNGVDGNIVKDADGDERSSLSGSNSRDSSVVELELYKLISQKFGVNKVVKLTCIPTAMSRPRYVLIDPNVIGGLRYFSTRGELTLSYVGGFNLSNRHLGLFDMLILKQVLVSVELVSLDFSRIDWRTSVDNAVHVIQGEQYYGSFMPDPDTFTRCSITGHQLTRLSNMYNERIYAQNSAISKYAASHMVYTCPVCGGFSTSPQGCDRCNLLLKDVQMSPIEFGEVNGIRGYGYEPNFNFSKTEHDTEERPLYLGVELEVDTGRNDDEDDDPLSSFELDFISTAIKRKMNDNVYITRDGSLTNGFEIVTHPATLSAHNTFNYKALFDIVNKFDLTSTDSTGLHIHVERLFFGNAHSTQMYNGAKMAYLLEKFWSDVYKFTRRDQYSLTRWANKRDMLYRVQSTTSPTAQTYRTHFSSLYGSSKYVAVNTEHSHTFEIRIFKGTTDINVFKATLQFVDNLARLVKSKSLTTLQLVTFDDIINYGNHAELKAYWASL